MQTLLNQLDTIRDKDLRRLYQQVIAEIQRRQQLTGTAIDGEAPADEAADSAEQLEVAASPLQMRVRNVVQSNEPRRAA